MFEAEACECGKCPGGQLFNLGLLEYAAVRSKRGKEVDPERKMGEGFRQAQM